MDGLEAEDIEAMATLFDGFGQRTRLAILLGFYHGNSTTEIAETLDMTRAGLTNHLQKMGRAHLLQSADAGYDLTVFGRFFAEWVIEEQDRFLEATQILEQADEEVRAELSEEVNKDYLESKEWEQLVSRELWKRAEPELEEILFD